MSTTNSPLDSGPVNLEALARLGLGYAATSRVPSPEEATRLVAAYPGEAELRALWPAAEPVRPQEEVTHTPFDVNLIRRDFPILAEQVNGRPLVWLDNAATTQKPRAVIDRLKYFYEHENSNVHRAAHELAARATDAYEGAREKVRGFLNASSAREIVFVRGATEAINLVAQSWGRQNVGKGDEIVITWLEHHANIVPWQQLAEEKGAKLRVAPVDDTGQILLDEYGKLLGPKTNWWPSPRSRTPWAPSRRQSRSWRWPTPPAPKFWSTARSRSPTAHGCSGARQRLVRVLRPQSVCAPPASACFMAKKSC